tara:strand:- start:868 stop:1977 length:1110 start_codon:yes stop_codon:yes gene_type:complete
MSNFKVDTVIIGAGVVGLSIARELLKQKKEVLIIESEDDFGRITSSRNSGVIHAGIYYSENSLKAKFCLKGNELLYDYCKKNFIPHLNTKKLLIATSNEQIKIIDNIKNQAEKNHVEKITKITKNAIKNIEPLIKCEEALLIQSSGIIDAISFMRSLVGNIEDMGGMISYNSSLKKIDSIGNKFKVFIEGDDDTIIECKEIVNAAGLFASDVAKKIEKLNKEFIPKTFYAKGNYFSSSKKYGIKHLIYPIPDGFSLGIHLTLELDGSIKFGPDVEWVENPYNYKIDSNRKSNFVDEIIKYFPTFDINTLQPSYSGIRPIINKKDKSMRDFQIQTSNEHKINNLINLYGIESPGLTSSLAIAKHVSELLK